MAGMALSFRRTQRAGCAKLVVWTPARGSERATALGAALADLVLKNDDAPGAPARAEVVFEEFDVAAHARGTPFEAYAREHVIENEAEGVRAASDAAGNSAGFGKGGDKKTDEAVHHFSDFFQMLVLWVHGGVYLDGDVFFLRDTWPLWGSEFVYQWSFIFDGYANNAVMGMRAQQPPPAMLAAGAGASPGASVGDEAHVKFAKKLVGTPKPGSRCCKTWGPALWGGAAAYLHVFPSPFFDPFWLRHDLSHSQERSVKRYPTTTGEARGKPSLGWDWIAHAPRPGGAAEPWFFDGAFMMHWHAGAGAGADRGSWHMQAKPGSFLDELYTSTGIAAVLKKVQRA